MYNLGANKNFMDSVHGYISVPKFLVENIVDTEWFQRLRNIEQTGMKVLYPNAKHDRFSHSLGVFYLGQRAVDSLLEKFLSTGNESYNAFSDIGKNTNTGINLFRMKNKVLFLIECLLHDIGHTPYSHSLEAAILDNTKLFYGKGKNKQETTVSQRLKELITSCVKEYCQQNQYEYVEKDCSIKAAPHEQLGALLIFEQFKESIKNILIQTIILNEEKIDRAAAEDEVMKSIDDDLCFVARMIMGIKYTAWQQERQVRNCFIELLNGANFDVDKLDYIIRDTQMSGISNVAVDAERLLSSLCIITKTQLNSKESLKDKEIKDLKATFIKNRAQDVLRIKGNIHGCIVITKGTVKIEKGSVFEYLRNYKIFKNQIDEAAKIKYTSGDYAIFSADSEIKTQDGLIFPEEVNEYREEVKQLYGHSKRAFSTSIRKAKVLKKFEFIVMDKIEIGLSGVCDIEISGEFETVGPINVSNIEHLDGSISEIEVFGNAFEQNYTNIKEASEKGFNTFSIGFKKQAINCIASVLDARNYLYLWVYAHHKVIYYANFLIPVLSEAVRKYMLNKTDTNFPAWTLNYSNLRLLDDAYLWTTIKYLRENGLLIKENAILSEQLFSRKYYTSLYKSLAEFDSCFETFSNQDIITLNEKLTKKIHKKLPAVMKDAQKTYVAGFLMNEVLKGINEQLSLIVGDKNVDLRIAKLIFIPAAYKLKTLDTKSVYIDMGNDEIVPINLISLLSSPEIKVEENDRKYFYLYYQINERPEDIKKGELQVNKIVRTAIIEYFRTLLKN